VDPNLSKHIQAKEDDTSGQIGLMLMHKMATELIESFKELKGSSSKPSEDDLIHLVDGDKPVSRKELKAILTHHSYSLSSYTESSMPTSIESAACL